MGLFSKRVPERKWRDVAPALGLVLRSAADKFYPTFLSHTASKGLALSLGETGRHNIDMLLLSAAAATILENGYAADPEFFLGYVYICMTGRRSEQMQSDVAEYNLRQIPGDARASLNAWASNMAKELSGGLENATLAAELVGYGALLVIQAKISTCEACGDRKSAEGVRRAVS